MRSCGRGCIAGVLLAAAAAVAGAAAGCSQAPPSGRDAFAGGLLPTVDDPERMSLDVLRLVDESTADGVGIATAISRQTKDPAVRERMLRAKLSLVTAAEMIVRAPDPRKAFILAWVLNEQRRQYFLIQAEEAGPAEWVDEAAEFGRREEERILAVGRRHFGEDWIARMAPEVTSYAATHPVTEHLIARQSLRPPDAGKSSSSRSVIDEIVAVPFSPFSGLQGVGDTPEAVRGFTLVAADFGETVHRLPTRLRWEAQLLLFEIESLESVRRSVESVERATVALESFSRSAESLPRALREEADALIASATEAQEPLRATLAKAEETSASLEGTIEALKGTIDEAKPLAASVTDAGEAWRKAAESVSATLLAYERIAGAGGEAQDREAGGAEDGPREGPEDGPEEGPDALERMADLAREFRYASEDLRLLLADLDEGKLDEALARTGASVDGSVDHASARFGALATGVALRAVCVLAAGFALLLAYRCTVVRLRPRGGDAP